MEFTSMRALFAEIKRTLGLKCEFCGEDHPALLETHYANMCKMQHNIERFGSESEITLCSNCHKKLHYSDWEESIGINKEEELSEAVAA